MKIIDFHVHLMPLQWVKPPVARVIAQAKGFDFETYRHATENPDYLIKLMDEANIERLVLIAYQAEATMGYGDNLVEYVASYAKHDPARLIPVGSINPHVTQDPRPKLEWLFSKLEARLIKLHPVHQLFKPNAYRPEEGHLPHLQEIYEYCESHRIPVLVHTGTSIFPGARIKYGDPVFLDDVATDFPKLPLVMCHGGRPLWYTTAFFLLRKHPHIYLDISSIPPHKLLEAFPRLPEVADRVVYGSDWPSPGVKGLKQNIAEILRLNLSDDAKRRILHDTAARLLH